MRYRDSTASMIERHPRHRRTTTRSTQSRTSRRNSCYTTLTLNFGMCRSVLEMLTAVSVATLSWSFQHIGSRCIPIASQWKCGIDQCSTASPIALSDVLRRAADEPTRHVIAPSDNRWGADRSPQSVEPYHWKGLESADMLRACGREQQSAADSGPISLVRLVSFMPLPVAMVCSQSCYASCRQIIETGGLVDSGERCFEAPGEAETRRDKQRRHNGCLSE